MHQIRNDRELIKGYRLDRAGIMFVVDFIKVALTSQTQQNITITSEAKVNATLRYNMATGKMQQHSNDYLGLSQLPFSG